MYCKSINNDEMHETINNSTTQNLIVVFWYILVHETIKNITIHNHSVHGLFNVFDCMGPSTTSKHRIIVAMVSSV